MLLVYLVWCCGVELCLLIVMLFIIYIQFVCNCSQVLQVVVCGYVGIVVDVCGKCFGIGIVVLYEIEGCDVYVVIDWISWQFWSDGWVGMYGGSYFGFVVWVVVGYWYLVLKIIVLYVVVIFGFGLLMENNVFFSVNYVWLFYVVNICLLDDVIYDQYECWLYLVDVWYIFGWFYWDIDQIDGMFNLWLQCWLCYFDYDVYWQDMVLYGVQFVEIVIFVLSIIGYYDDGQIFVLQYFKEYYCYWLNVDYMLLIGLYDYFGVQFVIKVLELCGYMVDFVVQFDILVIIF